MPENFQKIGSTSADSALMKKSAIKMLIKKRKLKSDYFSIT